MAIPDELTPLPSVNQDKKHKCYEVLISRRRAVKTMIFRKAILADIIDLSVRSYIPPSMLEDEDFHHWHCFTSAFTKKPRSWTMKKIADSICRLDVILSRTKMATDKIRLRFPPPIIKFTSFMNEVEREAEIFSNENIQSSRVKLGKQKGLSRIQDNMDMTELSVDSFDVNNCPYCCHKYVVPIGMDIK